MKKNAYLIPGVVAFVCQLFVMSINVIITLIQNQVVGLFSVGLAATRSKFVVPASLITAVILCLFYCIYLAVIIFYNGRHRRIIAGVFLALTLLTLLCCSGGASLYNIFFSRQPGLGGTAYQMVKMSYLTSMINMVTLLPGLFTSSMFYISLGRFGMSDPED